MYLSRRNRLVQKERFVAGRLCVNSCLMMDTICSEALWRQMRRRPETAMPHGREAHGACSESSKGNASLRLTVRRPPIYGTNPGATRGARWRNGAGSERGASMASRA